MPKITPRGDARDFNALGFTLIELMITVVIVGVLAAIAFPSYRSHVIKSNRASAQSYMMSVSTREEQLMLDQRQYTSAANNAAMATAITLAVPNEVSKYYNLSVVATTAPPAYTISAVPVAGTMQANDGTMTLTNTGVKTPSTYW